MDDQKLYLVLGCGDVGFTVAAELKRLGKESEAVLVLAADEVVGAEVKWFGASAVVASAQTLGQAVLERLREGKGMAEEGKLQGLLKELGGRLAIVLRDNPDTDVVASGIAMKRYAKAFGIDADIIYHGDIQPRAAQLVNALELELIPAEKAEFNRYSGFALVGVSAHKNCALPTGILPTIVIDNHPVPVAEIRARFCDIRIVGAVSTLLAGYLMHAGIELDEPLATALAFGIFDGTAVFTREAVSQDMGAFQRVLSRTNMDLFRELFNRNCQSG